MNQLTISPPHAPSIMEIILRLCHYCDKFNMENLERLLSLSKEVHTITTCPLCNTSNTRLIFKLVIPIRHK